MSVTRAVGTQGQVTFLQTHRLLGMWSGSIFLLWLCVGMGWGLSWLCRGTGHSVAQDTLLCSPLTAQLWGLCAGPGAAAMDHLSLMATVHFHLDRGISISVCHLFTTVRLKTQISCFLPHTTPDALWAQEPQRIRGSCRPAQGTARGENTGPLELRGSPQHLCTCNCCTAFCALSGPR